ncbi:MAG: hypothetical protein K2F99_09610, partial [Muribaculaceae bacterium]|nr:hypothetical protein [Muribaculaceae bacterium]
MDDGWDNGTIQWESSLFGNHVRLYHNHDSKIITLDDETCMAMENPYLENFLDDPRAKVNIDLAMSINDFIAMHRFSIS